MAIETLGEKQKRAAEEGEGNVGEKRRNSGNKNIKFLRGKAKVRNCSGKRNRSSNVTTRNRGKIKWLTAFLGSQQKSMCS